VTLTLDNQDSGIQHNIAVSGSGGGTIASTEIAPGPNQTSVTFTAPGPGSYSFVCEVHPRQMVGTLVVE